MPLIRYEKCSSNICLYVYLWFVFVSYLNALQWKIPQIFKNLYFNSSMSLSVVILLWDEILHLGYMRMVCWSIGLHGINGRKETPDDDVSLEMEVHTNNTPITVQNIRK